MDVPKKMFDELNIIPFHFHLWICNEMKIEKDPIDSILLFRGLVAIIAAALCFLIKYAFGSMLFDQNKILWFISGICSIILFVLGIYLYHEGFYITYRKKFQMTIFSLSSVFIIFIGLCWGICSFLGSYNPLLFTKYP